MIITGGVTHVFVLLGLFFFFLLHYNDGRSHYFR